MHVTSYSLHPVVPLVVVGFSNGVLMVKPLPNQEYAPHQCQMFVSSNTYCIDVLLRSLCPVVSVTFFNSSCVGPRSATAEPFKGSGVVIAMCGDCCFVVDVKTASILRTTQLPFVSLSAACSIRGMCAGRPSHHHSARGDGAQVDTVPSAAWKPHHLLFFDPMNAVADLRATCSKTASTRTGRIVSSSNMNWSAEHKNRKLVIGIHSHAEAAITCVVWQDGNESLRGYCDLFHVSSSDVDDGVALIHAAPKGEVPLSISMMPSPSSVALLYVFPTRFTAMVIEPVEINSGQQLNEVQDLTFIVREIGSYYVTTKDVFLTGALWPHTLQVTIQSKSLRWSQYQVNQVNSQGVKFVALGTASENEMWLYEKKELPLVSEGSDDSDHPDAEDCCGRANAIQTMILPSGKRHMLFAEEKSLWTCEFPPPTDIFMSCDVVDTVFAVSSGSSFAIDDSTEARSDDVHISAAMTTTSRLSTQPEIASFSSSVKVPRPCFVGGSTFAVRHVVSCTMTAMNGVMPTSFVCAIQGQELHPSRKRVSSLIRNGKSVLICLLNLTSDSARGSSVLELLGSTTVTAPESALVISPIYLDQHMQSMMWITCEGDEQPKLSTFDINIVDGRTPTIVPHSVHPLSATATDIVLVVHGANGISTVSFVFLLHRRLVALEVFCTTTDSVSFRYELPARGGDKSELIGNASCGVVNPSDAYVNDARSQGSECQTVVYFGAVFHVASQMTTEVNHVSSTLTLRTAYFGLSKNNGNNTNSSGSSGWSCLGSRDIPLPFDGSSADCIAQYVDRNKKGEDCWSLPIVRIEHIDMHQWVVMIEHSVWIVMPSGVVCPLQLPRTSVGTPVSALRFSSSSQCLLLTTPAPHSNDIIWQWWTIPSQVKRYDDLSRCLLSMCSAVPVTIGSERNGSVSTVKHALTAYVDPQAALLTREERVLLASNGIGLSLLLREATERYQFDVNDQQTSSPLNWLQQQMEFGFDGVVMPLLACASFPNHPNAVLSALGEFLGSVGWWVVSTSAVNGIGLSPRSLASWCSFVAESWWPPALAEEVQSWLMHTTLSQGMMRSERHAAAIDQKGVLEGVSTRLERLTAPLITSVSSMTADAAKEWQRWIMTCNINRLLYLVSDVEAMEAIAASNHWWLHRPDNALIHVQPVRPMPTVVPIWNIESFLSPRMTTQKGSKGAAQQEELRKQFIKAYRGDGINNCASDSDSDTGAVAGASGATRIDLRGAIQLKQPHFTETETIGVHVSKSFEPLFESLDGQIQLRPPPPPPLVPRECSPEVVPPSFEEQSSRLAIRQPASGGRPISQRRIVAPSEMMGSVASTAVDEVISLRPSIVPPAGASRGGDSVEMEALRRFRSREFDVAEKMFRDAASSCDFTARQRLLSYATVAHTMSRLLSHDTPNPAPPSNKATSLWEITTEDDACHCAALQHLSSCVSGLDLLLPSLILLRYLCNKESWEAAQLVTAYVKYVLHSNEMSPDANPRWIAANKDVMDELETFTLRLAERPVDALQPLDGGASSSSTLDRVVKVLTNPNEADLTDCDF